MKKNLNILIVEDDPNLGLLLTEYLKAKGYKATLANDGQKGYDLFKSQLFNFLILDVMMPIKDGFTLAKEIRQINNEIPILFLTAKSMKEDTLKGFEVGADDYMTKPFSMEELLARMEAILRRSGIADNEMEASFEIGKFQFDKTKQILTGGKEEHKLTTKENDLLYLLCKNKNGVLERNAALKFIWGDDNYFNGRSMDVYIAKLRKYLKEDPTIEIINVHGRGFKLLVSE
jgi:two-component system OmpR family response regulator